MLAWFLAAAVGSTLAPAAAPPASSPPAVSAECRYMGQVMPTTPVLFDPPLFKRMGARFATNLAFEPDFRRVIFTEVEVPAPGEVKLQLMESRCVMGRWTVPVPIAELFAAGYNSAEAAFSPDGAWLYFSSNRPPGTPPWNTKVFRSRITAGVFGAPEYVQLPVPETAGLFYPQQRADGSLYITTDGLNAAGQGDMYLVPGDSVGNFQLPSSLGPVFNTPQNDWDVVEHPQGHLRVWASGRDGGAGGIDLYYSLKRADGEWAPAVNIALANTSANETAPRLSPDGEMLFFQRQENGRERIYWMSMNVALQPAAAQ